MTFYLLVILLVLKKGLIDCPCMVQARPGEPEEPEKINLF